MPVEASLVALCIVAALPVLAAEPPAKGAADAGAGTTDAPCEAGREGCPAEYSEQIVVTATRAPARRDRVGSAIDVLSAEDLSPLSGRLVADVLSRVPGVDVRRTGGPGSEASIFLRGADSDHTLVLVDGIAVNDPSTPARAPFATHLDLDGVERIEVLRGPQSTIWGSDAIGGVVNIVTATGERPGRVRAWTEAGTYSTAAGGLAWSDRLGDADVSLAGSRLESGGFSQGVAGVEDDPYDRTSFHGRARVPLGESVELDASVRLLDATTAFDGFLGEEGQEIEAFQAVAHVAATVRSGERWTHRVSLRRAEHERDTLGSSPSEIRGRVGAATWLGTFAASPGHALTIGTELERERADFGAFVESAATLSAFAEDRFRVRARSGTWSGSLGARIDDHERFGAETTLRAAAAWRRDERAPIVRASVGTGFKAPSIAELDPRAFAGNADLGPETSLGADAGVEWTSRRGRATLAASLFASTFDDLIVAVLDPATLDFRNVNVDRARARGVELSAIAAPLQRLRVRGAYTWTDTEAVGSPEAFGLADGAPLLRRPEHKGSLRLDWRFGAESGRGAARASLDVVHAGRRKDLDPATFAVTDARAWTVAHAAARYAVSRTVTLHARVENVTDEAYQDVLGFATPGRSLYLGLSAEIPLR